MKVLIFGTGDYYRKYIKWFKKEDVVALLDNDYRKQGSFLDGFEVLSPEAGIARDYEKIFILSVHDKAMKEQLLQLGVEEQRICKYSDLYKYVSVLNSEKSLAFYGKAELLSNFNFPAASKPVLLMSHNLDLNGASLALFYTALVLKQSGYAVWFASWEDGELRQHLEQEEIPVLIDSNLQIKTYNQVAWIDQFEKIICNTLNYYYFLSKRNPEKKIIWWLHDPVMFYRSLDVEVLKEISLKNLYVYAVGNISAEAFLEYRPEGRVSQLIYGIPEHVEEKKKAEEKLCFVTIGNVQDYKGQDLLVSAVKMLSEEYKSQIEIKIVGPQQSVYASRLMEEAKSESVICFLPAIGREEIHNLLAKSDVLICPSRVDTMSIVSTEAMMHSLPCIISDAAGISVYVEHGKNSMLMRSENVADLIDNICWCVDHREELACMGAEARKVYETYFSMDVFCENVCRVMKEVYGEDV